MSANTKTHLQKMPSYYLMIGLFFLLVNFGYFFGRIAHGEKEAISPTLLVVSGVVALFLLRWIRKRFVEMDRHDAQR